MLFMEAWVSFHVDLPNLLHSVSPLFGILPFSFQESNGFIFQSFIKALPCLSKRYLKLHKTIAYLNRNGGNWAWDARN